MTDKIFDISIHMDLGDNGGIIAFRSLEQIKEWAEEELDAWNFLTISPKSDNPRPIALLDVVERQMSGVENILEIIRNALSLRIPIADAEVQIRKYLSGYATAGTIHRNSVLGRMIGTMKDYHAMVLGMISGAVGSATPDAGHFFDDDADVEAFTLGYALGLQFKVGSRPEIISEKISDLEKRLDNVVERTSSVDSSSKKLIEDHQYFSFKMEEALKEVANQKQIIKKEFEALLSETKETIDGIILSYDKKLVKLIAQNKEQTENIQQNFEKQVEKMKDINVKQIEELEESCLEKLKMKPSIEYWMDISRINTIKSIQLTVWFGIIGLFGVFSTIGVSFALFKSGLANNLIVIASVMGLIVFVFITLLMILLKSRGAHEKSALSAQQKVVMIETVEALEKEGKLGAGEKKLFIKSLMKENDFEMKFGDRKDRDKD